MNDSLLKKRIKGDKKLRIIAFVGMPASGKSEASNVAKEMGIPVVTMGDVIRKEVQLRGADPADGGKIANELREKEGLDAISKRCMVMIEEKMKETPSEVFVIDGVRGIAEVDYFKERLGHGFMLVSIAIDSPIEERFDRIAARKREDDMDNIEQLKERDAREIGWGMGEAIAASDRIIENTSTLDVYRNHIRQLFEEMIEKEKNQ
ncbi:MAG: flagellar hook-basal body complex protein FliE [Methanosarcinales archaeon]|jgi:dephospho-CoA kinase|nr:flagellar hook-basal body complex protein FliE [Methanosarcinales archaeon]